MKILITAIVALLNFSFLLWEHFHGGVTAHHILHREDLPAISNWWGGLLMPLLTWFLLTRIEQRIGTKNAFSQLTGDQIRRIVGLFVAGLIFGLALSASFTYSFTPFLDHVLYLLLFMSLLIPIFYAEFMLGFIIGMTYTFGAILPCIFISVMALVGFVLYRYVRRYILKLVK